MSEPLKSPLSRSGEQYDDLILMIQRDSKGDIIVPNEKFSLLKRIFHRKGK